MRLDRMGSMHQSRLSFLRQFLRRASKQNWKFNRDLFEIDARGLGTALYRLSTPLRDYTLVCFSHDLPDEMRSDRVIASAWDATFTLYDGRPSVDDIKRLNQHVPYQEEGRLTQNELCLSRANRSVRLWDYVLNRLAEGKQPNLDRIKDVGYLMRTTAVYGSGKFGTADRRVVENREEANSPFQLEMMTVYLIRTFVMDLIEHLAEMKNPERAVKLDSSIRRSFGVGNSTGLGMAPFLINHPRLIHNWFEAKENAIATVKNVKDATQTEISKFKELVTRLKPHLKAWQSEHPVQIRKNLILKRDIGKLEVKLENFSFNLNYPWKLLCDWSEVELSTEGQEMLNSLILEPYGHLIDTFGDEMSCDETKLFPINGDMTIEDVKSTIEKYYGWALAIDWSDPNCDARAWYTSEEKLEPRLGERYEMPELNEYEQALQPGRDIARAYKDLCSLETNTTMADFLNTYPKHRHIMRRCLTCGELPFSEIRDNTIDSSMLPIDMLRAKLSFFGACHFDPRSDRWVRINMFKGAPFPDELSSGSDPENWIWAP